MYYKLFYKLELRLSFGPFMNVKKIMFVAFIYYIIDFEILLTILVFFLLYFTFFFSFLEIYTKQNRLNK